MSESYVFRKESNRQVPMTLWEAMPDQNAQQGKREQLNCQRAYGLDPRLELDDATF